MTQETRICPDCQQSISSDSPGGLCPACLLAGAMQSEFSGNSGQETLPRKGIFQAPPAEDINQQFANIELVELLGQGGMGAVYRARQVNLDRPVALKILSPQLGDDPGFRERFEREAKTLARLNHPNIVTVYDFGYSDRYCYLVMELVDGVNLREAIETGGITAKQALGIVPRICEALQYAHDQGVVHRDIKPENILVGLNDQVKIADFGLAKLLDGSDNHFTLTATQQVLGTRNYMAPEQIEKPLTVDHRADIYSLGVVFYELLTGELPLGRFSLPSEKADVNAQMDEVVLRALEKEPGRRFQQASAVKSAVEAVDLSVESPLERINGKKSQPLEKNEASIDNRSRNDAWTSPKPDSGRRTGHRRVSLPFSNNEAHWGASQIHGIAHANQHNLEIEYRVQTFGLWKSPTRIARIPYDKITNIVLRRNVFSKVLEVQSGSLETFDELSGSNIGCLLMNLSKDHDDMCSEFMSVVRERIDCYSPARASANGESTAPALAHVPFKNSVMINSMYKHVIGIAQLDRELLKLDFEICEPMGTSRTQQRATVVPIEKIIAVKFHQGVIADKLEIQTNSIDSVSSIPNSSQGKFHIKTRMRDRQLAIEFARQLHRVTGIPLPQNLVEPKPASVNQPSLSRSRSLATPLILLTFCALINVLIATAMVLIAEIFGYAYLPLPEFEPIFVVGPILAAVASVALIVFLLRKFSRMWVISALVWLTLPWHVGALVSVPVAISCWIILGKQGILGRQSQTRYPV